MREAPVRAAALRASANRASTRVTPACHRCSSRPIARRPLTAGSSSAASASSSGAGSASPSASAEARRSSSAAPEASRATRALKPAAAASPSPPIMASASALASEVSICNHKRTSPARVWKEIRWPASAVFSHAQRTGLPRYLANRCVKIGPSAPLSPSSCMCCRALAASTPETAAGAPEEAGCDVSAPGAEAAASCNAATRRPTSRSLRRAIRPLRIGHGVRVHAGRPPNAGALAEPSPPS